MIIYPNPVVGERLQLLFTAMPEGLYTARLLNSSGQLILNTRLQCSEGDSNVAIPLPKNMAHGTYQLDIGGPGNINSIQKFSN